ncbi:MAG TPA: cysteine hydrolase family protein [Burkholderiaceae bacterium]|nr:cysteine hydrolase family protein [Burkholderiaceae bacterium]
MSAALVLIDIQNDYFPGGRMTLDGADAAAENAARLLEQFRERGWPLFHIQHVSMRPNATFFIAGTAGIEFHATVVPRTGEPVLQKNFPNAFRATRLDTELRSRGITELVMAGMMTHMCIDTSVRAGFDLGFKIDLAFDACATRNLRFGETEVGAAYVQGSFIAALNGTFATARTTAHILAT